LAFTVAVKRRLASNCAGCSLVPPGQCATGGDALVGAVMAPGAVERVCIVGERSSIAGNGCEGECLIQYRRMRKVKEGSAFRHSSRGTEIVPLSQCTVRAQTSRARGHVVMRKQNRCVRRRSNERGRSLPRKVAPAQPVYQRTISCMHKHDNNVMIP
jgi:hypothetical protein